MAACTSSSPARSRTTHVTHLPELPQRSTLAVVNPEPLASGGQILADHRLLPTELRLPRGRGPWPLVVFIHGLDVGPSHYASVLKRLTRAGYVVAAPSVPQEDPARGYPLDRSVLAATEPRDISAVLDALAASAYARAIDWSRVAVFGHSDGADVALSVGFDPAVRDRRVNRVVALAADPLSFTPVRDGPWLLLAHGTMDEMVPYAAGRAVFAAMAGTATCMVTLVGGSHSGPLLGDVTTSAFEGVYLAFLAQRVPDDPRCPTPPGDPSNVQLEAAA